MSESPVYKVFKSPEDFVFAELESPSLNDEILKQYVAERAKDEVEFKDARQGPLPARAVRQVDVCVVGAGASGLCAARDLQRAGLEVCVVEARPRVGGRLLSGMMEGHLVEEGGQWVSPDQDCLLDMIKDLGLETYTCYRKGEHIYIDEKGVRTTYTGDLFPMAAETKSEMLRLNKVIDDLVTEFDVERPWDHPKALELDQITFRHWLRTQSEDETAVENTALFVAAAMLTKPAYSFSALQAIRMASSAGSFSNLVDAEFILNARVKGGLAQVPALLAKQVKRDNIILNQPVIRVRWTEDKATVVCERHIIRCRHVVLAVSPAIINKISFVPALPYHKIQMFQHMSMGLVLKIHAIYESPFWREQGLSGTCFSSSEVVHECYDNTNWDENRGAIVAFVAANEADALLKLSEKDRKAAVLQSLVNYYGEQARQPLIYHEGQWATDEWTGGAYAASFDLGGLTRFGPNMRSPVGPILFSCSDVAGKGYQHVDGALRVGHDTAAIIIAVDKLERAEQKLPPRALPATLAKL